MKALILVSAVVLGVASIAKAEKPAELPACAAISKSCEGAGFVLGGHNKNAKGLWTDCIEVIAKGKPVSGVTGSAADAQACLEAQKATKKK